MTSFYAFSALSHIVDIKLWFSCKLFDVVQKILEIAVTLIVFKIFLNFRKQRKIVRF